MKSASNRFSRRALASFAAVPLMIGAKVSAQTPPAAAQTPPAAAPTRFQSAAQQLSTVKLARNIEPASRFEA